MFFKFITVLLFISTSEAIECLQRNDQNTAGANSEVHDVILLSGFRNSTFIGGNFTNRACIDKCSEEVDYGSLFKSDVKLPTWPMPINPMYYNKSFAEFCTMERRRVLCIRRECGARNIWASGLLLCDGGPWHERFMAIMADADKWPKSSGFGGTEHGVFGMMMEGDMSSDFLYPMTGHLECKREPGAQCTTAKLFAGPRDQFDEWPMPYTYLLPANYTNEPFWWWGWVSPVADDATPNESKTLATLCQHLVLYTQSYRGMLEDMIFNSKDSSYVEKRQTVQQALLPLVDLFAENVLSEYARQLWRTASAHNKADLLTNTRCVELMSANFSLSRPAGKCANEWFRYGQRTAEQLGSELGSQLLISGSHNAWGHSRPTLVVEVHWQHFPAIQHMWYLIVYAHQLAMNKFSPQSVVFDETTYTPCERQNSMCDLYPRQFVRVRLVDKETQMGRTAVTSDVNCLTPMSCAAVVRFADNISAMDLKRFEISELTLGVNATNYQTDVMHFTDYSQTLSDIRTTTSVLILFHAPQQKKDTHYTQCTQYCYVKAICVADGYRVYSNQPTCAEECIGQREDSPLNTDYSLQRDDAYMWNGLPRPPLGYPNVGADGDVQLFPHEERSYTPLVGNFLCKGMAYSSCYFQRDAHAYDWLSTVTFYHNLTHVFANDPYGLPTFGSYAISWRFPPGQDGWMDGFMDEIHVDPLRSTLFVLQETEHAVFTLQYFRCSDTNRLCFGVRRYLIDFVIDMGVLTCTKLSDSWNGAPTMATMALDWHRRSDNKPSIVILAYHYDDLNLIEQAILWTFSWDGSNCSPFLKCTSSPTFVRDELLKNCTDKDQRAYDLRLDAHYLYFSCQTLRIEKQGKGVGNDSPKEWVRLQLDTCEITRTSSVTYSELTEEAKSWNSRRYATILGSAQFSVCDSGNSSSDMDVDNYMQQVEVEASRIYQILPYSASNYPLPPLDCWQLNVTLRPSILGRSLSVHVGFKWPNCPQLSRPPVDVRLVIRSLTAAGLNQVFQERVKFDDNFDKNDIAIEPATTYELECVIDWSHYYRDQSCVDTELTTCMQQSRKQQFTTEPDDRTALWVIGVLAAAMVVTLGLVSLLYVYNRRQHQLRPYRNLTRIPSSALHTSDVLLGGGNFGKVFQGTYRSAQKRTTVPVAIKVLNSVRCTDADRRRFQEEVLLLSDLNSPYVLKAFGICMDSWQVKFVTELVPGGNLLTFLKDETNTNLLQMDEIARALSDVAKGLMFIHRKSVVHNDLSARNCLITLKNRNRQRVLERVQISDFGLAKNVVTYYSSVTGHMPFPMHISAPEVHARSVWSRATDVWQFGCLVWQTLRYGAVPFLRECGGDAAAIREQLCVQRRTPQLPARAPSELRHLAARCFSYDDAQRPTAADLVNTLELWRGVLRSGRTAEAVWRLDDEEIDEVACFAGSSVAASQPVAPPMQLQIDRY